jgi:LmbE family N-acetylglucosaminyl deacetylase
MAAVWAVRQWVRRLFAVPNPDLAARQGRNLTRRACRVLAVTAHPDDLDLLAGGTLRLLALAGSRITVVVATSGSRQLHARSNEGEVRRQEQRDAGRILGYDDIRFFRLADLDLATSRRFAARLDEVWEEVDPDLVLTMDPTFPYPFYVHPDHLAVGRAVLERVRTRPGGAQPVVLFYGSRQANVLVDVTRVLEDKIQAVLAHRSQRKTWPWVYRAMVRALGRLSGRQAGMAYAESFRCLDLPPLRDRTEREEWPIRPRAPLVTP